MTFKRVCEGPLNSEYVYDLPISKEAVNELYNKSDKKTDQFVIKDTITDEAQQVKCSPSRICILLRALILSSRGQLI